MTYFLWHALFTFRIILRRRHNNRPIGEDESAIREDDKSLCSCCGCSDYISFDRLSFTCRCNNGSIWEQDRAVWLYSACDYGSIRVENEAISEDNGTVGVLESGLCSVGGWGDAAARKGDGTERIDDLTRWECNGGHVLVECTSSDHSLECEGLSVRLIIGEHKASNRITW